jgi:hypothetical protein
MTERPSPSFSLPLSLLPLASSSLPLSFLPLNPPHYFSPSFLSILLTTSLPPSYDEEVVKQVLKRRFEGRG